MSAFTTGRFIYIQSTIHDSRFPDASQRVMPHLQPTLPLPRILGWRENMLPKCYQPGLTNCTPMLNRPLQSPNSC